MLCRDLKLRLRFRRWQMKNRGKPMAGVASRVVGDLFGDAAGDILAAAAVFGTGESKLKQEVCAALIFGSRSV